MTVSLRVMSAGHGYRYLLASVACGDGGRDPSTALTDYYVATGTPPGEWMGSALPRLGDGQLRPGDLVIEEQLRRLVGHGRDPVTGVALGRVYPVFADGARHAVAGYDVTFSAPKSVSTLWALADATRRRRSSRRTTPPWPTSSLCSSARWPPPASGPPGLPAARSPRSR